MDVVGWIAVLAAVLLISYLSSIAAHRFIHSIDQKALTELQAEQK